ncbi:MAG: hypothetical protein JXR91_06725 [Deltaproteobacteria bacterium]|nr:hypothetical protein [Deltaproteobacteria bacterium]
MSKTTILKNGLALMACLWLVAACNNDSNKGSEDTETGSISDTDTTDNTVDTSNNSANDGSCEADSAECLTESIGRVCPSDGYGWVSFTCADDEECLKGACKKTGDTLCTPGEKVCATDNARKTCDNDGSQWVVSACAANEVCTDGECLLDTDSGICTPNEKTCMSADVALKCNTNGSGYVVTDCPENTTCTDGACRGSVCEVGAIRCDDLNALSLFDMSSFNPSTILKCVDGESWVGESCASGEFCSYGMDMSSAQSFGEDLFMFMIAEGQLPFPVLSIPDNAVASCQKTECMSIGYEALMNMGYMARSPFPGDEQMECNDAKDGYKSCEGMPPFSAMKFIDYSCPEGTVCDPYSMEPLDKKDIGPSFNTMCTMDTECIPGDSACVTDANGNDGISTCKADGTWGATVTCDSPNDSCNINYSISGMTAVCMNPACAYLNHYSYDIKGVCQSNTTILACDADGNLAATATDCPGYCNNLSTIIDGVKPGYCSNEECVTGAKQCLSNSYMNVYKECVDGRWSSEYKSCGADEQCINNYNEYPATVVCGECIAGETQCTPEGLITCQTDNTWGDAVPCSFGECVNSQCQAECVSGEVQCVDYLNQRVCSEMGLWEDPVLCAESTTCIVNRFSKPLGCVECAGSNEGNYYWHVADSMCTLEGELQICGPDNTWLEPAACEPDSYCDYTAQYSGSINYSRMAACSID